MDRLITGQTQITDYLLFIVQAFVIDCTDVKMIQTIVQNMLLKFLNRLHILALNIPVLLKMAHKNGGFGLNRMSALSQWSTGIYVSNAEDIYGIY